MSRVYFDLNYNDRELAKSFGAKWDDKLRKWYAPDEAIAAQMETKFPKTSLKRKRDASMFECKQSDFFIVENEEEAIHIESLGADWDIEHRCYKAKEDHIWQKCIEYYPQGQPSEQKHPTVTLTPREIPADEVFTSMHFEIPFVDKNMAKELGARWTKDVSKWSAKSYFVWDAMRQYWTQMPSAKELPLYSE